MTQKWKSIEARDRLLAALVASLNGQGLNYRQIALYYGGGATYDAVEGQFRAIRKNAAALRKAVDEADAPGRGGQSARGASSASSPASASMPATPVDVSVPSPVMQTSTKPRARAAGAGRKTPAASAESTPKVQNGRITKPRGKNGSASVPSSAVTAAADLLTGQPSFSQSAPAGSFRSANFMNNNPNGFANDHAGGNTHAPPHSFDGAADERDEVDMVAVGNYAHHGIGGAGFNPNRSMSFDEIAWNAQGTTFGGFTMQDFAVGDNMEDWGV